MTVRDIVASYLRYSASENIHSDEARRERLRVLGEFADKFGDILPQDLKPFHLTDWVSLHPRWKSVATRRTKSNQVRACFQWAARGERIARNPFASVSYPEAERRVELPDEGLERVLLHASKPFERAVRFLRLTGCRLGELCNAQWQDVDLEVGLWTIHRHKSRKFTGKAKIVALVPGAVDCLKSVARAVLPEASQASLAQAVCPVFAKLAPAEFVFLNTYGRPWTRSTLGSQLRRLKDRHGIEFKGTLHGIRHTFASKAIGNGASVKLIAEQLGHSTTIITERYYYHRGPEHLAAMRQAAALGIPS